MNIHQVLDQEIVPRLVTEFQPEAIYLFGSYAWGQPTEESDLDVMVIVNESQQTPAQRAARAQHCLRGLRLSVDVLVKTRSEFERELPVYASLEAQIAEKGKLLYKKELVCETFTPIDHDRLVLLANLPPSRRVRVMLEARELAAGLIRGRLRRRYPDLSLAELNLKLLEEVSHVRQGPA